MRTTYSATPLMSFPPIPRHVRTAAIGRCGSLVVDGLAAPAVIVPDRPSRSLPNGGDGRGVASGADAESLDSTASTLAVALFDEIAVFGTYGGTGLTIAW